MTQWGGHYCKRDIGDLKMYDVKPYRPLIVGRLTYLEHILDRLQKFAEGVLLLGNDFNLTLDPRVDSSSAWLNLSYTALRRVGKLLRQSQLQDEWSMEHPRESDSMFYSHSHASYFYIDMFFFMKEGDLQRILKADSGSIAMLDHAPTMLDVDVLPMDTLFRSNGN